MTINYRKIPIISLFAGLIFGGSIFSEGRIIGKNFAFQNGLGSTIKTA